MEMELLFDVDEVFNKNDHYRQLVARLLSGRWGSLHMQPIPKHNTSLALGTIAAFLVAGAFPYIICFTAHESIILQK